MEKKLSGGVAHGITEDMRKVLMPSQDMRALWQSLTPLGRNEWICWIDSAKKDETRTRRLATMADKLIKGERRPCCWAGCTHR